MNFDDLLPMPRYYGAVKIDGGWQTPKGFHSHDTWKEAANDAQELGMSYCTSHICVMRRDEGEKYTIMSWRR